MFFLKYDLYFIKWSLQFHITLITTCEIYKSYFTKKHEKYLDICKVKYFIFLHTRVGDSRCVSKWYTTYVGDRFSEVMTQ